MRRVWSLTLFALAIAVCVRAASHRASACSVGQAPAYQIDPDEASVDSTPPGPVEVVDWRVNARESEGCCEFDSCDGLHSLVIEVRANDDRTPDAEVGYELRWVSGTLPDGAELPDYPVEPYAGGVLAVSWYDDDSYGFVLRLRAVDRAGNRGPSVDLAIDDGPEGCRTGSPGHGLPAVLALLAVLLARRRPKTREGSR